MPDLLDLDALLTAKQASEYARVSIATIVNWRNRGYCLPGSRERVKLPVAVDRNGQEIRDAQGRPRYRLLDVAKAEAATSKRARRAA